jgi:replicative DNA helicase
MAENNRPNRDQDIGANVRRLKVLARELNIPIIILCQLNRALESRIGDKRPWLTDLRDSGTIENDADIVLFIHRPEYYGLTQDEAGNSLIGMAEIIIAKHRNGSIGDVILKFKKEFQKFMNPEEPFLKPSSYESKPNVDNDYPKGGFDQASEAPF